MSRDRVQRIVRAVERPFAWCLLIAGLVTFVGVVANLIIVGDAKLVTLLVSADLFVSGAGAVQEAET